MIVRSLALRTDLALHSSRGRVLDRGDYLVVETPGAPNYFYGNLLVLPVAPRAGELAYWTRKFAEELRDPDIKHVTLAWDDPTGDIDPAARLELEAAGFVLDVNQVMTATEVHAAPIDHRITIRPLRADEIDRTAELGWSIADAHYDAYRTFLRQRAEWQRMLVEDRLATFWGAFDGTALVGSLGLVPLDGMRRYQDVQTAVTHRRRGIAGALLAVAANHGERSPVAIVAELGSEAARVYARVGFVTVEKSASACKRP